MTVKISCIQMTSTKEVQSNLTKARELIQTAADQGANLVILPENFGLMGTTPHAKLTHKETMGQGPMQDCLSECAVKHNVWIVGGTIPIAVEENSKKVNAACLLYNNQGEVVARYDKIHLFDVYIQSSGEKHAESATIQAGNTVVVYNTPFGKLGLSVCYDIRFPELFREMMLKGAEIIAVPSAFTDATGEAHWEVICRARAIENQVYVVAAAQTGLHDSGRKTFGHSMIVNPWGAVLAALPSGEGVVTSAIDLAYLHKLRAEFPVLKHLRR